MPYLVTLPEVYTTFYNNQLFKMMNKKICSNAQSFFAKNSNTNISSQNFAALRIKLFLFCSEI